MEKNEPNTLEPVTVGGWYERTDGTIGLYRWNHGQLSCERSVAGWDRVPDMNRELIEADRDSR